MSLSLLIFSLVALAAYSFVFAPIKLRRLREVAPQKQHSQNIYHSSFIFAACLLPSLFLLLLSLLLSPLIIDALLAAHLEIDFAAGEVALAAAQVKSFAVGGFTAASPEIIRAAEYFAGLQSQAAWVQTILVLALAAAGFALAARRVALRFYARQYVERILSGLVMAAALVAILTTLGIILSLLFEAARFFAAVPISEFLFGLHWSPQIAIRADQVGASGAFGAVPIFVGTLLITIIAMLVAVPIGLFAAIYLAEYAPPALRNIAKPGLEILAGIPTVVYGFFAALVVAPLLRDSGAAVGLTLSSESALAAGLVMGVMIIPFISSLSDDVISAVPQSLRDGAAALGATRSETIKQVVLPAALPGIISAVLLAFSRAIGETMIVVMAAGVAARLTANPFESVTTVTVQIVMLLIGDQEFDSPKTLAAFALGLVLFLITLIFNVIALYVVNKYRRQYD